MAALFAGRPPSQVEDERHFSETGVIITARRARLYPDHIERKYLIARCIEFFGFMAYPDLPREECMPNPLLRPRDPLFTFAQFGEAAFKKTRLTTIPENFPIEVDDDGTADVPEPASPGDEHERGEEFDVDDSDLEENDSILECLTDYCF